MKKNYVSPETAELKLVCEPVMNVVSGETTGAGTGDGFADSDDEEGAGKSRGEWGNLW